MIEMTFLEWMVFIQKTQQEKENYIIANSYITPIM